MRGRKPKPTAKKKLEGNPGKRKLSKREPTPKASGKIPPAEIDALAQQFIAEYLPLVQAMQIFTDADRAALELMSVHYSIAWQAGERVKREGLMLKNAFGWSRAVCRIGPRPSGIRWRRSCPRRSPLPQVPRENP